MKNYSSVLIIYNPNAMKGRIDEFIPRIRQRLLLRYATVDSLCTPEEGAEDLAYKHAGKYDIVVSCGGDGTLHEVVNGVVKSGAKCLIGVLPYGTCNDVAHTLNIPKNLDKALDCILRLNTTKYDLIFDGEDYITYALASGYLTSVSYATAEKNKRKLGRFAYILVGLKNLLKGKKLPITITYDGERIHGKMFYLMLVNGRYVGGFKLNGGEVVDNGKMKLVAIKQGKGIGGFLSFMRLFMYGIGAVKKQRRVIVADIEKLVIENHSNEPFTMDGEKSRFLKRTFKVESSVMMIKK